MSNSRKLRSKDAVPDQSGLFDFDKLNGLLHLDQPIVVRKKGPPKGVKYQYFNPQVPKLSKNSMKVSKNESATVLRHSNPPDDPLPDEFYEAFHKKMKKQEVSMTNMDRTRILMEADNLESQLTQLNSDSWSRYLPSICKVTDPKDFDEMTAKRQLTIAEINRLLRKLANWKKRQQDLKDSIKHFSHYYDNPRAEEEYSVPLEELRTRRRKERIKKNGPVIKLRLHNGFVLVCDPVCPPRLVKDPPSPKKKRPVSSPKTDTANSLANLKLSSPAKSNTFPAISDNPATPDAAPQSADDSDMDNPMDTDSPLSVVGDVSDMAVDSFINQALGEFPRGFDEDDDGQSSMVLSDISSSLKSSALEV